jgi:hypothetical protein
MDFPKVNADGEADGNEEMVVTKNEAESEEVMG